MDRSVQERVDGGAEGRCRVSVPLTAADLAAIEAQCAAATPGPWVHEGGRMLRCKPGGDTVPARTTEDARFIVSARTAVPRLLADVRVLRTALAEALDLVDLNSDAFDVDDREKNDATIARLRALLGTAGGTAGSEGGPTP